MMIDKVWLETSNIRVYERHPVIHLTKDAGYLAWFKVDVMDVFRERSFFGTLVPNMKTL